eukprot:c44495_g1_i1 orf=33-293(-)
MQLINQVKAHLHKAFDMKDLGTLTYFLGIEIYCNDDSIMLMQGKYTHKVLTQFHMVDSKPMPTPMDANMKFTTTYESPIIDATLYK